MSVTAARVSAKEKIDIPAFVDHLREVNKEAARIVKAPLGGDTGAKRHSRQELADALDELNQTLEALRGLAIKAPSASGKARASTSGAPGALVLDTTEAMVDKGQLVEPAEFQRLMGWASRQAVWKAADSRRVFYVTHKSQRYFPAFYSDPGYDRKHLDAVTKVLGDLPGGSKLQFFLTRKGSLGGETPLQALAAGRIAKVLDIAAAFAEVPMET